MLTCLKILKTLLLWYSAVVKCPCIEVYCIFHVQFTSKSNILLSLLNAALFPDMSEHIQLVCIVLLCCAVQGFVFWVWFLYLCHFSIIISYKIVIKCFVNIILSISFVWYDPHDEFWESESEGFTCSWMWCHVTGSYSRSTALKS
jgi:hypothetical protein